MLFALVVCRCNVEEIIQICDHAAPLLGHFMFDGKTEFVKMSWSQSGPEWQAGVDHISVFTIAGKPPFETGILLVGWYNADASVGALKVHFCHEPAFF